MKRIHKRVRRRSFQRIKAVGEALLMVLLAAEVYVALAMFSGI